jgi:hypothetical protein
MRPSVLLSLTLAAAACGSMAVSRGPAANVAVPIAGKQTLIGTDPKWLNGAGLTMDKVRGIVALDGAAYDVPRQLRIGARPMQKSYVQAFGDDPARQKSLSPTLQADKPNSPAFLILHVQRPDGVAQSRALAAALRKAGTAVEIEGFAGTGLAGHAAINRRLGEADYPATPVLDRWLAKVLA